MNQRKTMAWQSLAITLLAALPLQLKAQVAGTAPSENTTAVEEEMLVLSPFVVDASEGQEGYAATTTLAGSRVRTDLRDVGSAISVVTKKLMTDVGATNNQTLLQFTTNTEVGGVQGNFSGLGNTSVLNESNSLIRPSNNTRIRGLDSADNTRDYFLTEIPWDGYNVDRVEIQRGPNSILFGLGSPAGIINASLSNASFKSSNRVENRVSQHGSIRNILDVNYAVLKNELAVRLIGLDDNTKYQQKPAYNHDQRLYGALAYDPKFLKFEGASTSIRAKFETGEVEANRPRMTPPVDAISQFFDVLGKKTYDSALEDASGGMRTQAGPIKAATDGYLARSFGSGAALRFENGNATPTSYNVGTIRVDPNQGVSNNGAIAGLPFYRSMGTTAYAYWAANAGTLPGGSTGFYKDKSLADSSVFDFYNNLLDGDTKEEWQKWDSYNLSISQTFLNNRLGLEGVLDHQDYREGALTLLGGSPTLMVDTNSTIITGLTSVGGTPNPNAGRVTTAQGTGEYDNRHNQIVRDSMRLTGTAELRTSDFMDKGWLQKLLGRHVFTGLLAQDEKESFTRQFSRFAGGIGAGSLVDLLNDPSKKVNDGSRTISLINYLSGDIRGMSSPAGLNLKPLIGNMIPHRGFTNVNYFDTHWTAKGVDPTAAWTDPLQPSLTRTQADNPANYKGWTTAQVSVLNAQEGDIDALTYNTSKNFNRVKSSAITYQGYLWDDTLVGTLGYRTDKVMQKSGYGAKDPVSGVAPTTFEYDQKSVIENSGDSMSWSVVMHTPKELRKKLPSNTDVSVFYNSSENFKADAVRGDFMGNLLPNQTGETKDYGVVVTTLNDKLSLKVNWFETKVKSATLGGDAALGANAWYLRQGEIWGTMVAANSVAGLTQNQIAAPGWHWDYAANDLPSGSMTSGEYPRPAVAGAIDAKQLAAARAFLKDMPNQGFFDNYGYAINVADVQKENFTSLLNAGGTMKFTWDWQPAYGGNLKSTGAGPVVTVDTVSKGVEYELTAQPTKDWNIAINVAKTEATRQNLSATVESYIVQAKQKYDGPAGDLRLWGPGDVNGTLRSNWMQNIYYPYLFLKSSEGSTAAEIRPWRGNLMTSYSFSTGRLKGLYVGVAERWMQGSILGYGMAKDANGNYNLDVNKPYTGEDEYATDLWVGYQHKITKKIDWRVQLNLSNVGLDARLVAISVQPDGSPASYRIAEGMGWQLTNTFSF